MSALFKSKKHILSFEGDGAHIEVDGILTPNGPDVIDALMGVTGTSYKQIISAIYDAHSLMVEDGDYDLPIFLHVNSPGGTVSGAEATAAAVAQIAKLRPVVAVNEGTMASAAYWLSSAATDIVSRGRSTQTGSIGVLAQVVEFNSETVKVHNFTNPESPNKVPDASTDEGAKVYRDRVSGIYSVFRDDVIAGRGDRTSIEKLESLKGAVVTASEAVKVGLVDRVVGAQDSLYTPADAGQDGSAAMAAEDREDDMSLSQYLKEHPEAQAEVDALIQKARSEGESAEAKRHADVVAKIKPFIDGDYPERVKTACAEAISGERDVKSVLDLVAIFDEVKATYSARQSDAEQREMPDTPSAGPDMKPKDDESVKRDTEWNAAIKDLLGVQ